MVEVDGKALVKSKELWIAILTFLLANWVVYTGTEFPLTPLQIFEAGVALMAAVRIFVTQQKITKVI